MSDPRVSVRFLQPFSHGHGEDGTPEWPPSPLRLFQALVAANTHVEDLKLALASKQVLRPRKTPENGVMPTLSPKTVNKSLIVLHRMLVVARKRGLIAFVPDFEWLRAPLGEFDFLNYEEAKRLIEAADGQLRTMIIVALKTGLRHGELLALRWQDPIWSRVASSFVRTCCVA